MFSFLMLNCASSNKKAEYSRPKLTIELPRQTETNLKKEKINISKIYPENKLMVDFPAGWIQEQEFTQDGNYTTTYTNNKKGNEEKVFLVFESKIEESEKNMSDEDLFESFKRFCFSNLGMLHFSETKVIQDKKSNLTFYAGLAVNGTQTEMMILATTRLSEHLTMSFICVDSDPQFKECTQIFESFRRDK